MVWDELLQHARAWALENSWRVLASCLILIAGVLLALASRLIVRVWQRRRLRKQFSRVSPFQAEIAAFSIFVVSVVLVLYTLGLAGPIVGFILTIGFGLGVAADSFSGFRILGSRPFGVGDLIELRAADVAGTVEQITLSGTILRLRDGTQAMVPNRKMLDDVVVNHSPGSGQTKLRFQFVLDCGSGISALKEHLQALVAEFPNVDAGRGQSVWLTAVEPDRATFVVAFGVSWYQEADISSEFLAAAKLRLDAVSVRIFSLTPAGS